MSYVYMHVKFVSLWNRYAERYRSLQFRNINILRKYAYVAYVRRKSQITLFINRAVAIYTALVHLYNAPVSLVFGIYRHSSWLTFHLHDKAAWRCYNTAICIVSFYVWVQTRSNARAMPPDNCYGAFTSLPSRPPHPPLPSCPSLSVALAYKFACARVQHASVSDWNVRVFLGELFLKTRIPDWAQPDETNFSPREMCTSF